MNQSIKKIVEEYAESCAVEELELLRTLGKIPAPSHQEERRAEFCRDWFIAQGAKDVSIDRMKNVICKIGCEVPKEIVVFAAHTDIVFPDLDTLPMHEDEDKLYAPGIGDDTANLVNLMIAAKYLLQHPSESQYGFLIAANSCEEGLGNLDGTKEIFAAYGSRIKAFYSFDGCIPMCCNGAVGSYRYRVTCKTTGGHSFGNFGAPNSIHIICSLVHDIYQLQVPAEAKTTYNVGRIEGGSTVNSIAQEASMLYEIRSTSQKCLEDMEKTFQHTVDMHRDRGGELTVELLGVRPGNGAVDPAALEALTAHSADIIQAYQKEKPSFEPNSTDSNIPLSKGIPANTIGTVSGAGAHTREEWISKSSLSTGLKIALSLMLGLGTAENFV